MLWRKPKAKIIFTQDGEEIDIKLKFRPRKAKEDGELPGPHGACLIAYQLLITELERFQNGNPQ